MTRITFAFLLAFLCFRFTAAQTQDEKVISVQWPEAKTLAFSDLCCAGCYPDASKDGIPYVSRTFLFDGKSSSAGVSLTDVRVRSVAPEEVPAEMLRWLTDDFQPSCRITYGSELAYAVVEFVPMRRAAGGRMVELLEEAGVMLSPGQGGGDNRNRGLSFADHSVLAEGTWFKIGIGKDGIYKIDKPLLQSLGVDVASLNPQQINVYGNGGELLPIPNDVPRPDDLIPTPTLFSGDESDGEFNDADFLLFYGKGTDKWSLAQQGAPWQHFKHFYSDSAYYFIRIDDVSPLRVTEGGTTEPETHVVNTFQDYVYYEKDLKNLVKSGREFYGEEYDLNTEGSFVFNLPNMNGSTTRIDTRAAVRSVGIQSKLIVSCLGASDTIRPSTVSDDATSIVARDGQVALNINPTGSSLTVNINFEKANAEAVAWLDFIRINTTRSLQMAGSQMAFRDTVSAGPGHVARFQVAQSPPSLQVWDVTDRSDIRRMPLTFSSNTAEFVASAGSLREYIAFSGGFLAPAAIGRVENQDLHALEAIDLVIVSAPRLLGPSEELAAIHAEEGRSTVVVTAQQVFNEFSSGVPDVTAIKMLMKMLFDRAGEDLTRRPENLLLFGDGSIFNRGTAAHNRFNVITYQSENSLSPTGSFVSDDYFVFLTDDDGEASSDKLDCGVGRIPAASLADAENYVEKVRRYLAENTSPDGGAYCLGDQAESPFGAWRNTIVFVSDDQDGSYGPTEDDHMVACEIHAESVVEDYNAYDIVKLYMDAFTQESTPGGERYPEGALSIEQRVQNGALLVTYVGHGGERGWAHERILDIPAIKNWTNANRMPVFLTATCELARYDDNEFESAGEFLVMNPDGGAIAMLTTTRIVFSGSNLQLGLGFFTYALEDKRFPGLTLGTINRLTKNWVADGDSNKRNFSLLGDPALQMAYPKYEVYTTQVNNHEAAVYVDTLRALQEVEIRGYVGDAEGNRLDGFNGFVYPTVYDKRTRVITQNNDFDGTNGLDFPYDVFNKVIYKGKASVNAGNFTFRFVVPYDINFSIDTARVSYYAVAGSTDAHGFSQRFKVGGTLAGAELNTVGPDIELFLNDTTFVSGGITNESPVLIARLKDENGINTVGNGIGHDLQATLDNDNQNPIVLNDYYEADLDTYKSGEIRYQLGALAEGTHTLSLKAWDVHNNSAQQTLEFVVASSAEIALEHVLNYPNPFTTRTLFMFEHNQVCTQMDVRIQVFTIGGKLVKTLTQTLNSPGTRNEPLEWDGRDDFGDKLGRGVYVYKLEVRTETGAAAEKFEKLVILN